MDASNILVKLNGEAQIRSLRLSPLERISTHAASCARLLNDARFQARLTAAANITIARCDLGDDKERPASEFAILNFDFRSERIQLLIDLSYFTLLERICTLQDAVNPESEIVTVVRNAFFLLIENKCKELGLPKACLSIKRCANIPSALATIWIRQRPGTAVIPVWVTQFGEVPVLLNNVEDAPACDLTGPLLRLRMPGSLTVGQILLSVRVLNALSPGDVLLGAVSPEVASAIKAQAYAQLGIRWGGLAYRHVSGIATLCGSILTLKEWRMSDQDEISNLEQSFAIDNLGEEAIEEETTMDSVVELSELELPVKMEIGTIPISLEQLKSIRPGYVIALPQSIEGAKVRLSVGGQTIGQGELVAVGEHLGVRIIQMVQTYESAA